MSNTIQTITPEEIARRRFTLEQAEHSGEMEGLHVSPGTRADDEEWIAARIDIDELIARTRANSAHSRTLRPAQNLGGIMTDVVQTGSALIGVIPLKQLMAEVEKGQQLAGHFPDAEALGRARRVYTGEASLAEARAEIHAKYSRG
jgi:hypothetical protein